MTHVMCVQPIWWWAKRINLMRDTIPRQNQQKREPHLFSSAVIMKNHGTCINHRDDIPNIIPTTVYQVSMRLTIKDTIPRVPPFPYVNSPWVFSRKKQIRWNFQVLDLGLGMSCYLFIRASLKVWCFCFFLQWGTFGNATDFYLGCHVCEV